MLCLLTCDKDFTTLKLLKHFERFYFKNVRRKLYDMKVIIFGNKTTVLTKSI